MSSLEFNIGEQAKVSTTFLNGNTILDPTTVSLGIYAPSKDIYLFRYTAPVTPGSNALDVTLDPLTSCRFPIKPVTITRTGLGTYEALIPMNQSGIWWYAWIGTGTCPAFLDDFFKVKRSVFYPGI